MDKHPTYRFSFKGEISHGHDRAHTTRKLAKLFGISETELAPVFEGRYVFERTGLNKVTADIYQTRFTRYGALTYLEKETGPLTSQSADDSIPGPQQNLVEIDEPAFALFEAGVMSIDDPTPITPMTHIAHNEPLALQEYPTDTAKNCPNCHSANINSEKCLACGIYFEKFKTRTPLAEKNTENKKDHVVKAQKNYGDNPVIIGYKRKAVTIIKYSIFYLLAVLILDSYINNNRASLKYAIGPEIKISYLFYLFGNIALAYGSYYLALAKERSGYWGLAGLAGLPGLCVILLLKDEHDTSSRLDIKVRLITYAVIAASIFWMGEKLLTSETKIAYIDESRILRLARSEYPSTVIDENNSLYQSELDELNSYLDRGFSLLAEKNFDHHQIKAITDTMFSEVMRLFIWINYQQYMQSRNGREPIEFLERKNVQRLQIATYEKIQDRVIAAKSPELIAALRNWFIGQSDSYEKAVYFSAFNRAEFKIREKIQEMTILEKLPFTPPAFSFEQIEIAKFPPLISKLETGEDTIAFTFSSNAHEAAGKTLVIAYYYYTYQRYDLSSRKMKDRYYLRRVIISPDFPVNIIGGDLSVFDGAEIFPLMEKIKFQ